eukprot:6490957-Amphidinium_carterae.2
MADSLELESVKHSNWLPAVSGDTDQAWLRAAQGTDRSSKCCWMCWLMRWSLKERAWQRLSSSHGRMLRTG